MVKYYVVTALILGLVGCGDADEVVIPPKCVMVNGQKICPAPEGKLNVLIPANSEEE